MYIRIMGEDSIYINLENKARKKNPDNYIKILGRKKKKIKLFIFLNTRIKLEIYFKYLEGLIKLKGNLIKNK
ncbi:hypothetical protein PFAG_00923 [Plasmodium falciparum Santa Lucia]|uniref:Uncharacterized protein n=1 Tax=Plasmodium falciparum Santa Lucia TaxID=478859 RepID=W7FU84_PLAFA|nr:hypothetical protein PFAG_00923 [Plasmodium falciparum Santa Lucia]